MPTDIPSLFANALDLPPGERAAFLDGACEGDAAVRAEVDALLAAHEEAGSFLPAGPTIHYKPTAPFSLGDAPGTLLDGRYVFEKLLGEGGMGTVWEARQTEPVKRSVAIKLVKAGMDSRTVLARFEAERQALALMDHPNIARVFDAGAAPYGRPFFVMELVRGEPITKYCDDRRFDPQRRLELFVLVCDAVQHAHQKGVIHRDLKPANVLVAEVDGQPIPKVIDFGIAKAAGAVLSDLSIHTEFGGLVGTPAYMAPEQTGFNNLDIDTRADVYGLGALLYELLAGSPPFTGESLGKAGLLEMLRIVREQDPPPPSGRLSTAEGLPSLAANRGTEPRRLTGMLKSDLDWIVMKALEKNRVRRYETANGFAADVRRYIAGEPVLAHPPSTGYRLLKFARKNRGPAIAATLVFLALTSGIAGTTTGLLQARQKEREAINAVEEERQAKVRESQQRQIAQQKAQEAIEAAAAEKKSHERATEERKRAERARDRTRDVLDAMTSEVAGDSLTRQKEITQEQKKFLTEVLSYYNEFAEEKADDEQSRKRMAFAAYKVGMIHARLGRRLESLKAYQLANEMFDALAADFPAVPEYRSILAMSHAGMAALDRDHGLLTEAKHEYRQALVILGKLATQFPTLAKYRSILATVHQNHGLVLGTCARAEDEYHEALTILVKLTADFPTVPEYRSKLALNQLTLGLLLDQLGRRLEAETMIRQAMVILEKLAVEFPPVPEDRVSLAKAHRYLGDLLRGVGKRSDAEVEYRLALAICDKLVVEFPVVSEYSLIQAMTHIGQGNLLLELGKRPDAEAEYHLALAITNKLVVQFPDVTSFRLGLCQSHYHLGHLLHELGKRSDAEAEYRLALTSCDNLYPEFRTFPEYRWTLVLTHIGLGKLLLELGKRSDAEAEYRLGLEIGNLVAAMDPEIPGYRSTIAVTLMDLGALRLCEGRWDEADRVLSYALAIFEKLAVDFPQAPQFRASLSERYYEFACHFATASGMVAETKQECAERAMELLHKAVKAGFRDAANMSTDRTLDTLRGRKDFQELLASVQPKPTAPPPREAGYRVR